MKHSLSIFLLVVAGLWNAVLSATSPTSSVYPLRPSANGRYIVDASNAPFLIIGDAPHSILAKLNNSDAVTYLTDRGQRGFNALWIELLCDSYTFGFGDEGTPNYGRDVNGNNPFTATLAGGYYDLTTPNEAYWSHVDFIVQQAAANGLQCLFTPLDQGRMDNTTALGTEPLVASNMASFSATATGTHPTSSGILGTISRTGAFRNMKPQYWRLWTESGAPIPIT